VLVDGVDPLLGFLAALSPKPKFPIVASHRDVKLFGLLRADGDRAVVEIEIQRALLHQLPVFLLEVVQNAVVDLDPARLPRLEQSGTVLMQLTRFSGRF